MRNLIYTTLLILTFIPVNLYGQKALSIENCRDLALEYSKGILISKERIKAAEYSKKEAFTSYLPSLSANAAYIRNEKELSLLSNDVKNNIRGVGAISKDKIYGLADVFANDLPAVRDGLQKLGDNAYHQLNAVGEGIIDGLRTDNRNMYVGQLSLIQPLYMGGKIRAYNKITKFAENIAKEANNLEIQNVILSVDEAYWMVISLVNKKQLAEAYLELLNNLETDVQHLIDEGMATKADGLSIKVKVNEAEMMLTKVEDGLTLSKMLLCQICGLEITEDITLVDENIQDFQLETLDTSFNLMAAYNNRPEIKALEYKTSIFKEKVNINKSAYLPQVALMGNYMVTNPSLHNGFENKFRGSWNVGIMVKVPLLNWGKNIYKTREAKVEATIAAYELDEVKEKIELQINQSAFKVDEANKKLGMTIKNMEKAQENLNYATYGFEEGVIPANTLLEAHTNWLAAQSEKINAQLDVKLTHTYFKKAVGTLTK